MNIFLTLRCAAFIIIVGDVDVVVVVVVIVEVVSVVDVVVVVEVVGKKIIRCTFRNAIFVRQIPTGKK